VAEFAVGKCWRAIHYLADSVKDKETVILKAVKKEAKALMFASQRL
jgi:hypothetical protein